MGKPPRVAVEHDEHYAGSNDKHLAFSFRCATSPLVLLTYTYTRASYFFNTNSF